MNSYSFTERGQSIAQFAGLDEMVSELTYEERTDPLDIGLFDRYLLDDEVNVRRQERFKALAAHLLPGEVSMFCRALNITEMDNWTYLTGEDKGDRLFSVPAFAVHTSAQEEDQLVLSGLIGWGFRQHPVIDRFLSSESYERFGFTNRLEAAVFAGAYILSSIKDDFYKIHRSQPPVLTVINGKVESKISVGGTIHGDFRLFRTDSITEGNLSPAYQPVDFCLNKNMVVAGYHSVEPDIAACMFEYAFTQGGTEAVKALLDEFSLVLEVLAGDTGEIYYKRGNFADYGTGDSRFALVGLQLLISGEIEPKENSSLFRAPYNAQSPTLFDISARDSGLLFRNFEAKNEENTPGIEIKRDDFGPFFGLLVGQAQLGMGRTAPHQYIELLRRVKSIIDDPQDIMMGDKY